MIKKIKGFIFPGVNENDIYEFGPTNEEINDLLNTYTLIDEADIDEICGLELNISPEGTAVFYAKAIDDGEGNITIL